MAERVMVTYMGHGWGCCPELRWRYALLPLRIRRYVPKELADTYGHSWSVELFGFAWIVQFPS
jgi:hypothetical protein